MAAKCSHMKGKLYPAQENTQHYNIDIQHSHTPPFPRAVHHLDEALGSSAFAFGSAQSR